MTRISVHDLDAACATAVWADHIKPVFLVSLLLCTWLLMAFFLLSSGLEGSMFGYASTRTLAIRRYRTWARRDWSQSLQRMYSGKRFPFVFGHLAK